MEWIAKAVFKERARQILGVAGEVADEGRRTPELGRFNVVEDVWGMTVLLLDDLVTSGSHLFSAAGALKQAGAGEVRAVALGRFVRAAEFWEVQQTHGNFAHSQNNFAPITRPVCAAMCKPASLTA